MPDVSHDRATWSWAEMVGVRTVAFPILPANVADVLNRPMVNEAPRKTAPTWAILLLSVLTPPVAVAPVPSQLNAQGRQ